MANATNRKQSLGARGEQIAREHLTRQGYTILATNWHCTFGELDIVAQQGETIVFVEVRARRAGSDQAFASITPRKQQKLILAAQAFLSAHSLEDATCRFDAIALSAAPDDTLRLDHAEDVLGW
ncbi:MAG: YraN family protein [Anaerolineae bacterium]|nr:YraN family protein [Anaerolineae bacterium]